MDYKKAKPQDIVDDAKKIGPEAIAYLKELKNQTKVGKDGKETRISFATIRKLYFKKFHSDTLPKQKSPSIYDLIDEL